MQIRPSRATAVSSLVVAATLFALEPSALAQTTPPAKAKPTKPAPPAPTPAPAPAATPATAPEPPPAAAAEPEEDKRAIYLSADIGFTRPDLGGITDNLAFDKTKANGVLAGFGVGYRFRSLRLGARFRDSSTTEFSLWSLMGEIGYGLPFHPITPIIMLHAGYMFDNGIERAVVTSSLPPGNVLTPNVELDGLVLGIEANVAYSVTKFLRVGPFLGFDMTFLHRSQPNPPQSLFPLSEQVRNNALFGDSGSGVGYIFNIGLRLTGDVGF